MRPKRFTWLVAAVAAAALTVPLMASAGVTDPTIVAYASNADGDRVAVAAFDLLPQEGGIIQVRTQSSSSLVQVDVKCVEVVFSSGRATIYASGTTATGGQYFFSMYDGGFSNPSSSPDLLKVSTVPSGSQKYCFADSLQMVRVTSGEIFVSP